MSIELLGVNELIQGIQDAEKLRVRFMRQEMSRGVKRIRKSFIKAQLQGPPGIKAGVLAKGKNVFTFTGGENSETVRGKVGISRILNVHEQGMTIRPKRGTYLYLREHAGTSREKIIGVVPSVTIPARLKFEQQVLREAPAVLVKVGEAAYRGTETALVKAMKNTAGLNG